MSNTETVIFSEYNLEPFDVISFDIFDTLVYRLCHRPEDVFESLGYQLTDLSYSPTMFKALRAKAEARAREKARKCGKFEITFDEIYNELPFLYTTRETVMQQEIACEKNVLMLNRHMYDFLKYCRAQGKKIILVSDMYYSKTQIVQFLLHVGIEMHDIDDVFVSSDFNATKYHGQLYEIVIEKFGHQKILHIGDNYQSDVISAKRNGLAAIHYSPIIEEPFNIYQMESQYTPDTLDEIRSIRKLMVKNSSFDHEFKNGAFLIGAQIIGPVYTLFVEWVVDLAIKKGISKIVPLMREGELYTQLLHAVVKKRNLPINIETIYISRKSSHLAQYEFVTSQQVLELMQRNRVQLKSVFDLLLVDIQQTVYEQYASFTMEQLKELSESDGTLYDAIFAWLSSDETLAMINQHTKEQRQYLKQYIQQITDGKDFLTVDLGFNGTMQKIMADLLPKHQQSYHALVIAGDKVRDKILDGYKIFAWLGYAQENERAVKTIVRSPEIIEAVTNITVGSTKKYLQNDNGYIEPVLEDNDFPEQHVQFQKICWQGIITFQNEWLRICEHNVLNKLYVKRDGARAILQRLIEYPRHEEAKLLGALIQHEYCNFTYEMSIVNDCNVQWLHELGIEAFLTTTTKTFFPYEVYWPQGVVESKYPNYFMKKYIEENLKTQLDKDIYYLLLKLSSLQHKNVLIYGAGELGNQIFNMAKMLDVTVEAFIDRNYMQMPDGFHGLPVISLEQITDDTTHIIIASLSFKTEILNVISIHFVNRKSPQLLTMD